MKLIVLILCFFRLNSTAHKLKTRALGVCRGGVQGRARLYNSVTDEKLAKMMEVTYQQRTEAKMKWAVNSYNLWRQMRLTKYPYDENIMRADLNDIQNVSKENLEYSLCRFICEVKKVRENADYPGRTLYQMICSIQNYLRKNEVMWKLVHGDNEFLQLQRVLDNVMKQRASQNIGLIKKQAQVISLGFENKLWMSNMLGEDTPDKLRDTVLYLIGVNCALRAGDEHYNLRRPSHLGTSQFSFETNGDGVRCLVYREDSISKTNQGGLKDMKKERKIVWIKPSVNMNRCPVRLVEKYMNLLPVWGSKQNFYVQSLKKPKPFCWYSTMPVGINNVRKVIGRLLKDAGLDGYFTNHSLRRTCATRLFQAGTSSKLVKEITGHVSDAVNKYQSTSDAQRMAVSSIIQGDSPKLSEAAGFEIVQDSPKISDEVKFKLPKLNLSLNKEENLCEVTKDEENVGLASNVTEVIETAVKAVGTRKAKLSIELEFFD